MHDALFAAAARPARYRILGLPMLPYSIGHEILLIAQGNRVLFSDFDSQPANEQRAAVIRAALICCRNWESNKKPHHWLGLWSWRNRRADYALAIADFKNYRAEGCAFPPVPGEEEATVASQIIGEEQRKGRELGSPYMARLLNFLNLDFDFPFALANFLYLTHLEMNGDTKITNREESDVKQKMADIRARVIKAREAEKCQP